MRPDVQSAINLTFTKYLNQASSFSIAQETLFSQKLWCNLSASVELGQGIQIDNGVVMAERQIAIANTSQEWEALGQTRLTTIKSAMDCAASTSLLTFGTTPGCLAAPGTMSATKSLFAFV